MQALSMFLIVYAINDPLEEGSNHILSILGTLMYVLGLFYMFHIYMSIYLRL